jgi:predicted membrane protein
MHTRRHPIHLTGIVIGLLIALVGAAYLLVNLEVVPAGEVLVYWPSLIVAVGLVKLVSRGSAPERVFGSLLVLAGGLLQAHTLGYLTLTWSLVWPIAVVVIGLHLIWASLARRRAAASDVSQLDECVVFGGREARYSATDFRGGRATAIFGGCDIDLSRADLAGGEAVLDARALFGGVEIRVPEGWQIVLRGVPILGAFEDKTRPSAEPADKRLIINGYALFGAVEIKN